MMQISEFLPAAGAQLILAGVGSTSCKTVYPSRSYWAEM